MKKETPQDVNSTKNINEQLNDIIEENKAYSEVLKKMIKNMKKKK